MSTTPARMGELARPGSFGELLQGYRRAVGWTQEELAERARVSPHAISALERGTRSRPRRETVRLLADALGLTPAERAQLEATVPQGWSSFPSSRRWGVIDPTGAIHAVSNLPHSPSSSSADPLSLAEPSAQTVRTRTRLPTLLTPLVGRAHLIAAVGDLLRRADVRLVTLTGPGGIGKTSLALAVGTGLVRDYPDGIVFVSLEALTDHRLVAPTMAKALGLGNSGARSPWETLQAYLGDRASLLVLDNFEQLLDAASELGALLATCPRLTLLVTSRTPLHLAGEHEVLVSPLEIPEPGPGLSLAAAQQTAAVQLFVARAQAVKADFALSPTNLAAAIEVCRRLEGIPLALELVAARAKALSVEQIARRLDDVFRLLDGGTRAGPARQQTLRATLDWSFNLLGESERILVRRLAVFAGGFRLEAAESVGAGDGLARAQILPGLVTLVDHSLVVMEERSGAARYRLLEPVRQYLAEKLVGAGEDEHVRARHGEWCLALAARAEDEWPGARQAYWIDTLEEERDNLRAALGWGLPRDDPFAMRLAGSLWFFLYLFTLAAEGRYWLQAALEQPSGDPLSRAKVLLGLAFELREDGSLGTPRSLSEESLGIFEELGDRRYRGWALNNLGNIASYERKFGDARARMEASIAAFRAVGDAAGAGMSLRDLGTVWQSDGDLDRASGCYEESLALLRAQGDHWSLGYTLYHLASLRLRRGEEEHARTLLEEALAHFHTLRYQDGMVIVNVDLALFDYRQGDQRQARSRLMEAVVLSRNVWTDRHVCHWLSVLGAIAIGDGAFTAGLRLIGAAAARFPIPDLQLHLTDPTDLEDRLAAARLALGEKGYARIWAEGQAMTLEQAVDYALEMADDGACSTDPGRSTIGDKRGGALSSK